MQSKPLKTDIIYKSFPPNIERIREVLKPPASAIFCYAPNIYVPSGNNLPPHLVAHEMIHMDQQSDDPDGWWEKYLASPTFRLAEEVPAHVAEYASIVRSGASRKERRFYLNQIAKRLSGPLYGRLLTRDEAVTILKKTVI